MAEQVVCDWCLGVLKVWVHIVMCRCALVLSVRVNESVCVCVQSGPAQDIVNSGSEPRVLNTASARQCPVMCERFVVFMSKYHILCIFYIK